MLLKIATSVGILWFGYLAYEAIRWRKMCKKHRKLYKKVGYNEVDVCTDCAEETQKRKVAILQGKEEMPSWLKRTRDFSLNRFFTKQHRMRERFDGVMRTFRVIEPMCSYNSIDKIGTENYRSHQIPVKGGEEDMAKGKSPKKEVKKAKKGKKK